MHLSSAAPFTVLLLMILGGCSSDGSDSDLETLNDGSEVVSVNPSGVEIDDGPESQESDEDPTAPPSSGPVTSVAEPVGDDDCQPNATVTVLGLKSTTSVATTLFPGYDNPEFAIVDGGLDVPVSDYALVVRATTTDDSLIEPQPLSLSQKRPPYTVRSCAVPQVEAVGRLVDIDVVSDADLAPGFPAGSSLRQVAQVFPETELPLRPESGYESPVSLGLLHASPMPVVDYLRDSPRPPLRFALRFDVPTDASRLHRFTVTYALEDGLVSSIVTDPVRLVPPEQAGVLGEATFFDVWNPDTLRATLYLASANDLVAPDASADPPSPVAIIDRGAASGDVLALLEDLVAFDTRSRAEPYEACDTATSRQAWVLDIENGEGKARRFTGRERCAIRAGNGFFQSRVDGLVSDRRLCELGRLMGATSPSCP